MDLNQIKNLIEPDGARIVIVENGKPILVITSFEDYKKRVVPQGSQPHPAEVNQKNNPGKKTPQPIPRELEEEPLKLDDLPL